MGNLFLPLPLRVGLFSFGAKIPPAGSNLASRKEAGIFLICQGRSSTAVLPTGYASASTALSELEKKIPTEADAVVLIHDSMHIVSDPMIRRLPSSLRID